MASVNDPLRSPATSDKRQAVSFMPSGPNT